MQDRSNRGSGEPNNPRALRARVFDRDLIRGEHEGQRRSRCTSRPNTWAHRLRFVRPKKSSCQRSAVHTWEEDHGDQASLYFEDPNGIVLEITSPPSAPEQSVQRAAKAVIKRWVKSGALV